MLGANDLKGGVFFLFDGQPYEVMETHHLKMQQRRPVVQTRMRNVLNGKIVEHNFQQSESIEEADIQKKTVKFLYNHKDQYWFSEIDDASKRFQLGETVMGEATKFMKANTELEALMWNEKIINVELPIKMEMKVVEAPPSTRGNTAQGGVKQVKIETGATINVPLFINEGETIKINTQTGEYVERVSK